MVGLSAQRVADTVDVSAQLFCRVGEFLRDNHLSPDPLHYAFAYRVITDTRGPLAKAVAHLTDGGVSLSRRDIEKLGGEIGALAAPTPTEATVLAKSDGLVAQTLLQVEGFADMMQAMRADTEGFGRDLAASADEIRRGHETVAVDEVVRITTRMLDRVNAAETRLEAATHETAELRTKLEEARANARRDPLTDLPNRRAVEEAYAARSEAGEEICLAVCDIDHFKTVNDRFGHSIGDRVLKAIGEALRQGCEGHMVARYGGEEFAILFVGITREAALATLENAREAVASKRYRLRESDEPLGAVTFSAGLTIAKPEELFGTVFARADRLLYTAKDAGRNLSKAG
jgi:diguanylate cyclase